MNVRRIPVWIKCQSNVTVLRYFAYNINLFSSTFAYGEDSISKICSTNSQQIFEKPPRNSAGFCGGGQGLSWAVEPRKERRRRRKILSNCVLYI
jgi:hypothetical protein